jgi:hypothetical protein
MGLWIFSCVLALKRPGAWAKRNAQQVKKRADRPDRDVHLGRDGGGLLTT